MKNILKIGGLSIFMLIFSCTQESEIDLKFSDNNSKFIIKQDFKNLALMISSSLDEELMNYIVDETSKKFDGDYDILLAKDFSKEALFKTQENSKTLKDFLKEKKNLNFKTIQKSRSSLDVYFKDLLKKYPTLQISLPNYQSLEDLQNKSSDLQKSSSETSPLVAYNFDDSESITAFDKFGNEHELTKDVVPERPVIVVSESERIVAVEKNDETELSYYRDNFPCATEMDSRETDFNDNYKYYDLYDECDSGSGGGGGNPTSGKTQSDRDKNNNLDNLFKLGFNSKTDKREYESWWDGDAEVMVKVIFSKNSSGISEFGSTTKMINKGFIYVRWFTTHVQNKTVDLPIVNWETSVYGDKMKYMFFEIDDRGDTKKIETSFTSKLDDNTSTTVKGSFELKEKDLFMGDVIVNYKDKTIGNGTKYNTGSFSCWINQKK